MLVSWACWTTGHRTPQVATSTLLRLFMCLLGLVSPCRFWWTNLGLYARAANSLLTKPTFNALFLNFHNVKNQIVTSDVSLFLCIVINFGYSLLLPWAWKFVTFYFIFACIEIGLEISIHTWDKSFLFEFPFLFSYITVSWACPSSSLSPFLYLNLFELYFLGCL